MRRSRRIVLATGNPGKLREIREMLAALDLDIVPQSDLGVPAAVESGTTFAENAVLKARHAAAHAGLPAIADDSGLCIDILDGRPGIHSARYAGPDATDRENLECLLGEVARAGVPRPAARFHCAMAYVDSADDPEAVVVEAQWEGNIVDSPRGDNGFGYDPIFHVPTHGCTSAELAPEVKNRISHRAQALRALLEALRPRLLDQPPAGLAAGRP
jgi:XTP/dITP diphosphohydrolase